MSRTPLHLLALDPATCEIAWQCAGPDAVGACSLVAIGAVVPCVAHRLVAAGASAAAYTVPRGMTLCPVTLALALDADTPLLRTSSTMPWQVEGATAPAPRPAAAVVAA